MFGSRKKDQSIIKRKKEKIDYARLRHSIKSHVSTGPSVDEVTWTDLNMDDVFYHMDHTVTSAGEETLYGWLRDPLVDKNSYEIRTSFIQKFKSAAPALRYRLSLIDRCRSDFTSAVRTGFADERQKLLLYLPLALGNMTLLITGLELKNTRLLVLSLLLMIVNGLIHYSFVRKQADEISTLAYILRMLRFAKENQDEIETLDPLSAIRLREIQRSLDGIAKKASVLFTVEGLDSIADYLNIAMLLKEINFVLISWQIGKKKEELVELYHLLGKIDAATAIHCYKDELAYWSTPDFKSGSAQKNELAFTGLYHPLLETPVANDLTASRSLAITGSNMSGKSTFLRTIGINTILSQAVGVSLTTSYSAPYYRLISSISLKDDISLGKSYFLSEAEAIRRMIEYVDAPIPTLVLIDEIFKGTNPAERYAASVEILNGFAAGNIQTFVATHDLQILHQLEHYDFKYFTEQVTLDSLDFDYKIRDGIASTRNAIRILEYIHYPKDITERIYERLRKNEQ